MYVILLSEYPKCNYLLSGSVNMTYMQYCRHYSDRWIQREKSYTFHPGSQRQPTIYSPANLLLIIIIFLRINTHKYECNQSTKCDVFFLELIFISFVFPKHYEPISGWEKFWVSEYSKEFLLKERLLLY